LHAPQVAVWRARANAEAAVDQMAAEPVQPRGLTLRDAAGILAASRRLGIAGLTLHSRIVRIAGTTQDELIERFAGDLGVALRAIAEALRTGGRAEPLPPLRAHQIALERALAEQGDPAVEVLVSESDLIVDGINTIGSITERHVA